MAGIKQASDLAARIARECKDRDSVPGLTELQRHMRVVQQDFLILQQSRDKLTFENARLKKEIAAMKGPGSPAPSQPASQAAAANPVRGHDGFVWDKTDKT
ncbi:MAG TPA: hypothetical protein VFB36_00355 [Nevskiaceae bacterium]|nr:hypothetical protein [Nevskiaceae bacterium]